MSWRLWVPKNRSRSLKACYLLALDIMGACCVAFWVSGVTVQGAGWLYKLGYIELDRLLGVALAYTLIPILVLVACWITIGVGHERVRHSRLRAGCCWNCSYDLTAKPAIDRGHLFIRCPECGQKSMTKDPATRPRRSA